MNKSEKYQQRRADLKALSQVAQMAIKNEATDASHVNEWILDYYREQNPGIKEFNTFNQWKEKGFHIKKGSEAFVIWGSPRKIEDPEADGKPEKPGLQAPGEDDDNTYWPLCYLFSDQQVTERRYHEAEA